MNRSGGRERGRGQGAGHVTRRSSFPPRHGVANIKESVCVIHFVVLFFFVVGGGWVGGGGGGGGGVGVGQTSF